LYIYLPFSPSFPLPFIIIHVFPYLLTSAVLPSPASCRCSAWKRSHSHTNPSSSCQIRFRRRCRLAAGDSRRAEVCFRHGVKKITSAPRELCRIRVTADGPHGSSSRRIAGCCRWASGGEQTILNQFIFSELVLSKIRFKFSKPEFHRNNSYKFNSYTTRNRSRDSAVGIATGYGLDDRGVGVRVSVRSRIFFFPCCPHRLWGPPSLLSNG
jgi:hypothetical protein